MRISTFSSFACALIGACGGPAGTDAGTDTGVRADTVADSTVTDTGLADSGLVEPSGEMELEWVQRVTSELRLGGVAEARLAPIGTDEVAMSITLSGAPAVFAADSPEEQTIGAGETDAIQSISRWRADGTMRDARAIVRSDPVLDEFSALGYGFDAEGDALFAAGRFTGGARFGLDDPNAVTLQTVQEMFGPPPVTETSAEGYLARFDSDVAIEWTSRSVSDTGFADHRFVDIEALTDGSVLVLGSFAQSVTLGAGETNETELLPSLGAESEVFFARFAPDGTLVWARRVVGQSEPVRITAFDDESFVILFRYSAAARVGRGESNDRMLAAPPSGTLAWDAVSRFDANGMHVWSRPLGSDSTTYPGMRSLVPRADGSITVGGTFRGELSWVDFPGTPALRINATDGLIAQLDADGALVWQTRITPTRDLRVQAMAPTVDGGSWVAITVGQSGLATMIGAELFELAPSTIAQRLALFRVDAAGALAAAQHLASFEVDADDLLLMSDGDLVLAGRFGESTRLEPGTTAERPLPTASAFRNVFIARYHRR